MVARAVRSIFFGTPDFAVPCLESLAKVSDVVLVVSQPDKPQGRGLALKATPVKAKAESLGLPVIQPSKVRTPEFAQSLVDLHADFAVVVAYGRILPKAVLESTRLGCFNVHASLLPRWRGAAPIQWAIYARDEETGVTLMKMDEGLDTGAMLAVSRMPIGLRETSLGLFDKLSALGGELVEAQIPRLESLIPKATPQPDEGVTLARMIDKRDAWIDWRRSALDIDAQVRAFTPWPGTKTMFGDHEIKILETDVLGPDRTVAISAHEVCGTVVEATNELVVKCGEGALIIKVLQAPGKKALPAKVFLSGYPISEGARFVPAPPDAKTQ